MYQVKNSKDENFNNNVVSFKENISLIESIESCKICTEEKKKLQINSENYSLDKIFDNYAHLPKSDLLYFVFQDMVDKQNEKLKKIVR